MASQKRRFPYRSWQAFIGSFAACNKKRLFFSTFPTCLSRACLGKCSVFDLKWCAKKRERFRTKSLAQSCSSPYEYTSTPEVDRGVCSHIAGVGALFCGSLFWQKPSWCTSMPAPANIIVLKRLQLRLSGSARQSQKRFRDTPRHKLSAVFV